MFLETNGKIYVIGGEYNVFTIFNLEKTRKQSLSVKFQKRLIDPKCIYLV